MRFLLLIGLLLPVAAEAHENWPEFRGPTQQGHSDAVGLPLQWSETENVKWKTAIPGEGWSSPVVWGEQVWVTTATEEGQSRRAICVHRDTGRIVHDIEVFRVESPAPKNRFNSYASPTPVIEEGRVYVCFGADGSACIDTRTGQMLWKNTELIIDHKEGAGSSPILYRDSYILHCDGTDDQYVAALDKRTGRIAWKTHRNTQFARADGDLHKAYSVPLIISVAGGDQMISLAASAVIAYDPATGTELWRVRQPGYSNVPRPVFGHGLIYIGTGYDHPELWAIRVDGKASGDVTASHVAWKHTRAVPAKPSPILVDDRIYIVSDLGIASCLDARSGQPLWQGRLSPTGLRFSASPVYAEGRLYFFSENGVATVITPGPRLTRVAESQLDEGFMASPAIAGRSFYLRTKTHLYRIEQ